MKIVHINTYSKGGAAIAASRIVDAVNQQHINASLLVEKYNGQLEGALPFSNGPAYHTLVQFNFIAEQLYAWWHENKKEKNIRFYFSPGNTGFNISRHPLIKQADILNLHWINSGFLSLKSLSQLAAMKKPIVWTLHDMWAFTGGCHHSRSCDHYTQSCGDCLYLKNQGPQDLSNTVHKKKMAIYNQMNITVVTCSHWLQECAQNSSLLKDKKVVTIPNPMDTDTFQSTNKQAARQQLNLSMEKNILLFIAPNVSNERKGILYLKDALLELSKKRPEFKNKIQLIIIGRSKNDEKQDFGFDHQFVGYINSEDDMVNYYNAADLFLLPSLEENLPNTIMEAMSCGVPTVAFDVGGISDLIDHQKNGYLAKLRSVTDFVDGITWILDDDERYQQLSANAREKVVNNFDQQIVAKKYINLYQEILR